MHLNCWREAYNGLLPQDFLDQLPLSFKRRMDMWKQNAVDPQKVLFVAEAKFGIVGFSIFEPARDASMCEHAELGAIYLFKKFKGRKIGAGLLKAGIDEIVHRNFKKAYCWVLEGNPTIEFYKKSGAVLNGMEKSDEIGGKKVKELAFEWRDLKVGTAIDIGV